MLEEQKSTLYGGEEVNIYFEHYKFDLVSANAVGIACEEEGNVRLLDGFMILKGVAPKTDNAFRDLLSAID